MSPSTDVSSRPRFDSPLRLWIAIWQHQLVYGQEGCGDVGAGGPQVEMIR